MDQEEAQIEVRNQAQSAARQVHRIYDDIKPGLDYLISLQGRTQNARDPVKLATTAEHLGTALGQLGRALRRDGFLDVT